MIWTEKHKEKLDGGSASLKKMIYFISKPKIMKVKL